MEKYLLIGLGAVLGAYSRHWVGIYTAERWGTGFAWGTLSVNLIGSFILGLFLALHLDRGLFSANLRYFLAIGWCASFTTYSTFSWETFQYIQEGNLRLAMGNMTLTVIGCLLATWLGILSAKVF